eukprot:IDg8561t1
MVFLGEPTLGTTRVDSGRITDAASIANADDVVVTPNLGAGHLNTDFERTLNQGEGLEADENSLKVALLTSVVAHNSGKMVGTDRFLLIEPLRQPSFQSRGACL